MRRSKMWGLTSEELPPNVVYTRQVAKPECQQKHQHKIFTFPYGTGTRTQFTLGKLPNPNASKASTQNCHISAWHSIYTRQAACHDFFWSMRRRLLAEQAKRWKLHKSETNRARGNPQWNSAQPGSCRVCQKTSNTTHFFWRSSCRLVQMTSQFVYSLTWTKLNCTWPFNWGEVHGAGDTGETKLKPFKKSKHHSNQKTTNKTRAHPTTEPRRSRARCPLRQICVAAFILAFAEEVSLWQICVAAIILACLTQLISHHSSHTTHLTPLISHNSPHTTHLTPLISHHSSHTTNSHRSSRAAHLTPLISHHSSHTPHLTPLIPHHSSHTLHLTPLISHHSSHTTHRTPLISHHSSHTTHPTPLISHHSSHTTHPTPLISHHSSHTTHLTHNSSHTPHLTPLISRHSSHSTHSHHSFHTLHLTPLISHPSSHATHLTPLISHHSSHTTHLTPLIPQHSISHPSSHTTNSHHSSHTTHLLPNAY